MPFFRVTIRSQHCGAVYVLAGEFEGLQDALDRAFTCAHEAIGHACPSEGNVEIQQPKGTVIQQISFVFSE